MEPAALPQSLDWGCSPQGAPVLELCWGKAPCRMSPVSPMAERGVTCRPGFPLAPAVPLAPPRPV